MKSIAKTAVTLIALMVAFILAACGNNAGVPADAPESSAIAASVPVSAISEDDTSSDEQTKELVGKPWVTSVLSGNLPEKVPDFKDDIYTHCNYEYLDAHQGEDAMVLMDNERDLADAVTPIIKDESRTNHELEQLRIFYNQAADAEAIQAAGLTELQPYLDRIDAVESIDEMNALLASDDFPFSPFMLLNISVNGTHGENIVSVSPNFVIYDPLLYGGTFYQDSDDPRVQKNAEYIIDAFATYPLVDFMSTGMSLIEAYNEVLKIIDFEKMHGKHLSALDTFLKKDYGALAEAIRESYFTLDELCALCPNYPMREELQKCGKGGSKVYASEKEWLEAFNELWADENLEIIKLVAKAKVLGETRPYRDPSTMNELIESVGYPAPDAEEFAYSACDTLDTFSQVLAKLYVEDVLGSGAKTSLEALSQKLIDTYKGLYENTAWLGEESRARVIEKLNNMTINVLEPEGGYFDYSGLALTPTEEGGTLISNYLKLKRYRQECESAMIGQPANKSYIWFSIGPTFDNAFYDGYSNSISIYPGFVTSVIYNDEMNDEELLAGVGFTIGHEISHGFDYQGSQLDAYGQPNPLFDDADIDRFVFKCSALAKYFNGIEIEPGLMVDGQSVVGEAAADLCGMQAVFEVAAKTDGFDYEELIRYFAYLWAAVFTEETLQMQTVDVHPLPNQRINTSLQMFDVIYDLFGVAEGDGMYLAPEERIVIWGPQS